MTIKEIIYNENSILVFDIDGVLAKYQFGEHNHNNCSDAEWSVDAVNRAKSTYEQAEAVVTFQDLINMKGPENVYVCSVVAYGEDQAKKDFITRHYGIPESNIMLVSHKLEKLAVLQSLRFEHPELDDEMFVLIDDTIKTLTYVQENTGFSTCHVSTFLN
jgi:hypothetical protein